MSRKTIPKLEPVLVEDDSKANAPSDNLRSEDDKVLGPATVPNTTSSANVEARVAGSLTHGIVPVLQNLVATFNLGVRLDLKDIAKKARNAEFNPKRFSALVVRIRDPKTTALIFSTGKVVVTGSKSEADSNRASRKFVRMIKKVANMDAKFMDYKIQNMVASVDVKFKIQLEQLALHHMQFSSYEPEIFPGLIYRMIKPKICLLVFVSGKVVLTGGKSREDLLGAFENIYPVLQTVRRIVPQ